MGTRPTRSVTFEVDFCLTTLKNPRAFQKHFGPYFLNSLIPQFRNRAFYIFHND